MYEYVLIFFELYRNLLPVYEKAVKRLSVSLPHGYRTKRWVHLIAATLLVLVVFTLFVTLSLRYENVTPRDSAGMRPIPTPRVHVELDKEMKNNPKSTLGSKKVSSDRVQKTNEAPIVLPPKTPTSLRVERYFLPLVFGFFFGFVGSIPVAGPTSAMVLKLGIQGNFIAGHAVAIGGAAAEAV